MNRIFRAIVVAIALAASAAAQIKSPSESLGFPVGADRKLADYRQIVSYLRSLAAASPRIQIESVGKTTLGEDMIMAVISSEENMRNLPAIRETARKLADPRGLSDAQVDALARQGKAVVLVTCNIHSTEIASSQMAMEWAHDLVTAGDADTKRRLDNVVLLLVPSVNPDGQIIVTDWYRKNLGTKYEGGSLPWIYHYYVGHDNNRDWYMLTQTETKNLTRAIYHEWYPQVFVDEHQMGSEGPRMFIPPFADPLDPDVHPLIWREANLIGTNMAFRLEQQNKAGLIYGYSFDAYWLGGTRNTGWWKNITGLLLETASARIASPLYVEPTELRGGQKGLIDYKATVNHPNPWKGGWWRMRDIMDYERIASDALLEITSERRVDFLRDVATRARAAIAGAAPGEAYRIPHDQRDYPTARFMAALLAEHGVEVQEAANGDFWIPMAQPYAKFVTEMMEPQRYPEVRLQEGKEILRPYDVATWTLPLAMGVSVEHTTMPAGLNARVTTDAAIRESATAAPSLGSAESALAINRALKSGQAVSLNKDRLEIGGGTGVKLRTPRVGVLKLWTATIDEGWTRWLLDTYGFTSRPITPDEMRGGKSEASLYPQRPAPPVARLLDSGTGTLQSRFDAIILPDVDKDQIALGRRRAEEGAMRYAEEMPAEYRGGLGPEGSKALRDFVESGGTLIAFGHSCDYVMSEFNIPVRNSLAGVKADDFSVPGSLVRLMVVAEHPVTAGLPATVAAFIDAPIAFETTAPGSEMDRRVLAWYPDDAREILLSGWINGADRLRRKAAAVAVTYGKGKIVLLAFRPQHRGQTHGTFPFVFNSIWWSVM